MPLDPTANYPSARPTFPSITPTTFEDDDGYEHDLYLNKVAAELGVIADSLGPAPASGAVNVPAENTARRGLTGGKGAWHHPQGYWLTNKSGATRVAGDVVVLDATNDDAFTTTTVADSPLVLGVVEIGGAANARCPVVVGGRVAVVAVTAATRGQYLATSTTAGKAVGTASPTPGTFGVALTAASGGFCLAWIGTQIDRAIPNTLITAGYTAFTPTITQGGSAVNATVIRAGYMIIGKLVHVMAYFAPGAVGTSGNDIQIGLPAAIAAHASFVSIVMTAGSAFLLRQGVAFYPGAVPSFSAAQTVKLWWPATAGFLGTSPAFALATADNIMLNLKYEIA